MNAEPCRTHRRYRAAAQRARRYSSMLLYLCLVVVAAVAGLVAVRAAGVVVLAPGLMALVWVTVAWEVMFGVFGQLWQSAAERRILEIEAETAACPVCRSIAAD